MELELQPTAEQPVVEAVRRAARAAGLAEQSDQARAAAWHETALEEGVDRRPDQVPSPRSTRGATRA